ncbi:MAG: ribonuclease III [Candidatus Omnitrophica bacterium]|jgi:ribonuclease-3|nr:ribonuclease III [Candidatus Omnitrophota bacterium]
MEKLIKLEEKIGYKFKNIEILQQALTHSSYAYSENTPSYERLEFLGDAILNVIIAIYIYIKMPDKNEAFLTNIKAAYINRNFLQSVGENLQLQNFVIAKGLTNYRLDQIVEAIIGAIYIDGGMKESEKFIKKFLLKKEIEPLLDYKNFLKTIVWEKYKSSVHYILYKEEGPPHEKTFYIKVEVDGKQTIGKGMGTTKKEAEIKASIDFLKKMKLI